MPTTLPPGGHSPDARGALPPATGLERVLGAMSVLTMLMTVPQVWSIWVDRRAHGVSLASWGTYLVGACLWLVHGVRKRDRSIYVACVGWILLDAAIVIGVLAYGS